MWTYSLFILAGVDSQGSDSSDNNNTRWLLSLRGSSGSPYKPLLVNWWTPINWKRFHLFPLARIKVLNVVDLRYIVSFDKREDPNVINLVLVFNWRVCTMTGLRGLCQLRTKLRAQATHLAAKLNNLQLLLYHASLQLLHTFWHHHQNAFFHGLQPVLLLLNILDYTLEDFFVQEPVLKLGLLKRIVASSKHHSQGLMIFCIFFMCLGRYERTSNQLSNNWPLCW